MGLQKCADVLIGSDMTEERISGGERKRLSIACRVCIRGMHEKQKTDMPGPRVPLLYMHVSLVFVMQQSVQDIFSHPDGALLARFK